MGTAITAARAFKNPVLALTALAKGKKMNSFNIAARLRLTDSLLCGSEIFQLSSSDARRLKLAIAEEITRNERSLKNVLLQVGPYGKIWVSAFNLNEDKEHLT
jgi:hypothetical protein